MLNYLHLTHISEIHKSFYSELIFFKFLTNGFGQANQREEEYKNQIKTLTNRLKEVFYRKKITHRLRLFAF